MRVLDDYKKIADREVAKYAQRARQAAAQESEARDLVNQGRIDVVNHPVSGESIGFLIREVSATSFSEDFWRGWFSSNIAELVGLKPFLTGHDSIVDCNSGCLVLFGYEQYEAEQVAIQLGMLERVQYLMTSDIGSDGSDVRINNCRWLPELFSK